MVITLHLQIFLFSHWTNVKLTNVVHTTSGGSCEWLPHVDKLILEMLANRTPPMCIQANIFAMSRVLHLEIDIVRELPSLKHIKSLRTEFGYCHKDIGGIPIESCQELETAPHR